MNSKGVIRHDSGAQGAGCDPASCQAGIPNESDARRMEDQTTLLGQRSLSRELGLDEHLNSRLHGPLFPTLSVIRCFSICLYRRRSLFDRVCLPQSLFSSVGHVILSSSGLLDSVRSWGLQAFALGTRRSFFVVVETTAHNSNSVYTCIWSIVRVSEVHCLRG